MLPSTSIDDMVALWIVCTAMMAVQTIVIIAVIRPRLRYTCMLVAANLLMEWILVIK